LAVRGTHTVPFGDVVYIDAADFRLQDDPSYFGLAPGKLVGLKYAGVIR
jgi:glutaminyl-tRNA synthetase